MPKKTPKTPPAKAWRNPPGDRHRVTPLAVRLPADLRAWFRDHAASAGRPQNALVVEIMTAYAVEHGYEPPEETEAA